MTRQTARFLGHSHAPVRLTMPTDQRACMRSLILMLAVTAMASPLAAQATDAAGERDVLTVVEGFHAALESGDSARALAYLHPHVVIYEGGHAESLAEYRSGHLAGDIAFASATNRQLTHSSLAVWGDQALYTSTSRTTGQYRGREIDSRGTETIVLVRTAEGWRIRHIHWSSR